MREIKHMVKQCNVNSRYFNLNSTYAEKQAVIIVKSLCRSVHHLCIRFVHHCADPPPFTAVPLIEKYRKKMKLNNFVVKKIYNCNDFFY